MKWNLHRVRIWHTVKDQWPRPQDSIYSGTHSPLLSSTKPCNSVCWLLNVPATGYSVPQGRICSDNFTCCHTEIQVADQTFYLIQSQYTDTRPTSPNTDLITPDAWQGSHWSANFWVTGMTRPSKKSRRKRDLNPGSSAVEVDTLPLGQRGGPCNSLWT